ncbi:MAG: DUF4440 domain-containing protein [Planctomycetota bacterium]|jgi:hypothetical protein
MSRSEAGSAVRTEIEELHRFFERWLSGDEADFSRCDRALARDFTMVGPGGEVRSRDALVRGLLDAHGKRPVSIRIRNFDVIELAPGLALARYEEWHGDQGRVSTALFRARGNAPNGIEWVTVHETWLPASRSTDTPE